MPNPRRRLTHRQFHRLLKSIDHNSDVVETGTNTQKEICAYYTKIIETEIAMDSIEDAVEEINLDREEGQKIEINFSYGKRQSSASVTKLTNRVSELEDTFKAAEKVYHAVTESMQNQIMVLGEEGQLMAQALVMLIAETKHQVPLCIDNIANGADVEEGSDYILTDWYTSTDLTYLKARKK